MTRIALLSHSDNGGGASRAAYRLYRGLRAAAADTRMLVRSKQTGDWSVTTLPARHARLVNFVRSRCGGHLARLQNTGNPNMHSVNWLPSNLAATLNASDADVVNVHWLGGEAMSVEDLGRIRKPAVWTLHDMWAFCGAEHVTGDDASARWRTGYTRTNRAAAATGPDLDRHTWLRKQRAWTRPVQIVTPSRWLADCVRDSALLRDWPVAVIPNALDTDVFKPLDQAYCRHVLNLPPDQRIVLFGAFGGARSLNKGYDLLHGALQVLGADAHDTLCVVFGESAPETAPALQLPVRWMGHVADDPTLALLYGAADVMVIPSRRENLPQSGTEAHACGCPVVAFDCSGLPEVVDHCKTGYLAQPFDMADLARGIAWVLDDAPRRAGLGAAARAKALAQWSTPRVARAYLDIYGAAMARQQVPGATPSMARPGQGL